MKDGDGDEAAKINKKVAYIDRLMSNDIVKDDYRKYAYLDKKRKTLLAKVNKLTNGISISDHALLRYLERVVLIDAEKIRDNLTKIISKKYIADGRYQLADNIYAIIRNKVVTTIVEGPIDYKKN